MGKVGLVLGGGVAKGAYEAGALQALAEAEIRPSVIVGISAGALNGAMASTFLASESFTSENVQNLVCKILAGRRLAQPLLARQRRRERL